MINAELIGVYYKVAVNIQRLTDRGARVAPNGQWDERQIISQQDYVGIMEQNQVAVQNMSGDVIIPDVSNYGVQPKFDAMETMLETYNQQPDIRALADLLNDLNTSDDVHIQFFEEPSVMHKLADKFGWASEPAEREFKAEYLNDGLVDRLESGDIKRATLVAFDSESRMFKVSIKDGEVVNLDNGLEDRTPNVVKNFAENVAERTGENVTIQAVTEGFGLNHKYQLLNDAGDALIIDITADKSNDNTLLIGGVAFGGDYAFLENKPYSHNGGGAYGYSNGSQSQGHAITNSTRDQGGRVRGEDEVTRVRLPEYSMEFQKEFVSEMTPMEDIVLSRHDGLGVDDNVMTLQQTMLDYANAADIDIDLGSYQIDSGVEGKFKETFTNPGVDGQFGPKTERAVMNIQQSLGLEVTGVADQGLLDAMSEIIEENLVNDVKEKYEGERVDFVYADGSVDKQIPQGDNTYIVPVGPDSILER